jgi:hypothetical protein
MSMGPGYAFASLPSGPCPYDGEQCVMAGGATASYNGGPLMLCDFSGMECTCVGSAWQCVTTSMGAGVCPPVLDLPTDAGADASDAD